MKKKSESKKKKAREASKRSEKKTKLEKETKKGKVMMILPSPKEGEEIIIRKKEMKKGGTEINAMKREKGEKEGDRVGFITMEQQPDKRTFTIPYNEVREEYGRAGIGGSLDSIARKVAEEKAEKATGKEPRFYISTTPESKKFLESIGVKEGKKLYKQSELKEPEVFIKKKSKEKKEEE